MKNHLETARQIVDDEAGFDRANTPREVAVLLRVHESLARLQTQHTESQTTSGNGGDQ